MDSVNDDKARIILNEYKVTKTLHNAPTLYDLPFNIKTFKKSLQVVIVQLEDMEMEFDLIGIHIAIVNAFRRIIISDVPSMAIKQVHVLNNRKQQSLKADPLSSDWYVIVQEELFSS